MANIIKGTNSNDTKDESSSIIDISLLGLAGNDSLVAGSGNDTLDGGVGRDTLVGGLGNDVYIVDDALDVVTETGEKASYGGFDTVQTSLTTYDLSAKGQNIEHLKYTGVAKFIGTGNAEDNSITGGAGGDSLSGMAGADTLNGGLGADTLVGGTGDDTFLVDNVGDKVVELSGQGLDTIIASVNYSLADTDIAAGTLGSAVENLTLSGVANISATGNALDNTLIGNAGNNKLDGADGKDTLIGGAGNDTIIGGAGTDSLDGGAGSDLYIIDSGPESKLNEIYEDIYANASDVDEVRFSSTHDDETFFLSDYSGIEKVVIGTGQGATAVLTAKTALNVDAGESLAAVTIVGNAGNNQELGGYGNDTLDGGAGNDTIGGWSGSDLILGGAGNDSLHGDYDNDTLNGGADADTMEGGTGNNWYVVDNVNDVVIESGNTASEEGIDTIQTNLANFDLTTKGHFVENLVYTGTAKFITSGNSEDNNIKGGAAGDSLGGGEGADTLDGGVGADTLVGGVGSDLYRVDNAGDKVIELADGGKADTVESTITYTLTDNVEQLNLIGNAAIHGTGNSGDNIISGNSGNNKLDGASGDDLLQGGAGNDTLIGGLGSDTLDGDAGSDLYVLGDIAERATGETIQDSGDVFGDVDELRFTSTTASTLTLSAADTGLEKVVLGTGTAASAVLTGKTALNVDASLLSNGIKIIGNAGNNELTGSNADDTIPAGDGADKLNGNDGNDVLDGGLGADAMAGGTGNDTYVVENAGDAITELADAGIDTISTTLAALDLSNNAANGGSNASIENLIYTGAAKFTGTGNASNNQIVGGKLADTLIGNAGNDTLLGGLSNDTMSGGTGDDRYEYNLGDKVIESAGEGNDTLALQGANVSFDLTKVTSAQFSNVETIDVTGSGNNTVTVSAAAIDVLGDSTTLTIAGNAGDVLKLTDPTGWSRSGLTNIDNQQYYQYTKTVVTGDNSQTFTLNVDTDITQDAFILQSMNLSTMKGANGFRVSGEGPAAAALDVLSGAGDFNNDGYADILIGAPNQSGGANKAYLLFGSSDGINPYLELYNLDGSTGFKINAQGDYFGTGTSVSNIGDFNGDGYGDVLIGARNDASEDGASYVLFGTKSGYNGNFNLSDVNGVNGFQIDGGTPHEYFGMSVSQAGDLNGDGYADIVMSSELGSFVVFGSNQPIYNTINATQLNGENGFSLTFEQQTKQVMHPVASVGDINGDGYDDVIFGSPFESTDGLTQNGSAYVLYGKAGGLEPSVDLNALTADSGFAIHGKATNDFLGGSVNSAGDVNGDGISDFVVSAEGATVNGKQYSGENYVVFGSKAGFGATFDVGTLNGTTGFKITGEGSGDYAGFVSSAGDVNGDGYDDLLIGARYATVDGLQKGAAYVVFGKATGFTGELNLSTLDGANGFKLTGENDQSKAGGSVSAAGDINGDGYDDFLVGSFETNNNNTGNTYVVYGQDFNNKVTQGTTGTDKLTGTANTDNIVAGLGNDSVNGAAGNDALSGGLGNDTLDGGTGNDILKGGYGDDTYIADSAKDVVKESAQAGNDTIKTTQTSYSLLLQGSNVENLMYTGTAKFTGTGNQYDNAITGGAQADTLSGGVGDDTLVGGAGADSLAGGVGDDQYVIDSTSDQVLEDEFAGTDTVLTSLASFDLSSATANGGSNLNIEKITYTGAAKFTAVGNGLDNVLTGGKLADNLSGGLGNDTLNGGAGNDSLLGGAGDDTYVVDAAGDVVTEAQNAGIDTVMSSITLNLATLANGNVENLTLSGTANLNATGNGSANTLTGNTGNNFLDGGAGADTLSGVGGNDTYAFSMEDHYVGSSGSDVLVASGADQTFDLHGLGKFQITNIDVIDLTGAGDNQLILDASIVDKISDTSDHTLTIKGNAGDTVVLSDDGWSLNKLVTLDNAQYYQYSKDGQTLNIATAVSTNDVVLTNIGISALGAVHADSPQFTNLEDGFWSRSASAGDINNDGYDDMIFGAGSVSSNGQIANGAAYVVFGTANGLATNNINDLNGANGFKVYGLASNDFVGSSMSSAGDLNGDGFDDIVIGADQNYNVSGTGTSYVIYGKATGFDAKFDLASLNGSNGFKLTGANAQDAFGNEVKGIGDINGDGIDDLMIGAYQADTNGTYSTGTTYVVFGTHEMQSANINVATFDGTNGFSITNSQGGQNAKLGRTVSALGDVNGDGLNDMLITAPGQNNYTGTAYVVYGQQDGFSANFDVSTLNGTNGFEVHGSSGHFDFLSGTSAGDLNGDGVNDILLNLQNANSYHGASYVIYGNTTGSAASFDLGSLDGTNGFAMQDSSGFINLSSISTAGDVNGDGIDDFIVGGIGDFGSGRSAAYLIFGQSGGFDTNLDVSNLNGINGIKLTGDIAVGSVNELLAAGDINGDGYDDIGVTLFNIGQSPATSAGSIILYGKDFQHQVTIQGNAGDELLGGTDNQDVIYGAKGNDVVYGVLGNDLIVGGAGNDLMDGGEGDDTMNGGQGNDYFVVDSIGDVVMESSNQGRDGIESNLSVYSLADTPFVEDLFSFSNSGFFGTGNALDNVIQSGNGSDTLVGGAGADTLFGNVGPDQLTGGEGDDQFVFGHVPESAGLVTITDFEVGDDHLVFSQPAYAALSTNGVTVDQLNFTADAQDANDFFNYDTTTGTLYYDADGNGENASIAIAQLTGAPTITITDFIVQ